MTLLNKVLIKTKLRIMGIVPLIAVLLLSAVLITQQYDNKLEYTKLTKIIELNSNISLLIHETQKERGFTAGFLGSDGKKFGNKIEPQRIITDKQIGNLQSLIQKFDIHNKLDNNTKVALNNALDKLSKIKSIRNKVSNLTISSKNAIGYYTTVNSLFLDFISKTSRLSSDSKMTYNILSYYNFLESKERAGIERAIVSSTFANDKFKEGTRTKLESLIAEQNSYMNSFISLADKEAVSFKNEYLQGKSIDEVNRMRKVLLDTNEIGGFGISSVYWFDTITKKINLLKKVENYMGSKLYSSNTYSNEALKVAKTMANLLHETQKERGATAGFLGSKGKKFTQKLPIQRLNTNKRIEELKISLSKFDISIYSKNIKNNISHVLSILKQLNETRNNVDGLSIQTSNALKYYTSMNTTLLNVISSTIPIMKDAKITSKTTAYYNFLMAKERAGIERAVLANTFVRNRFSSGMKEKFTTLVTEQKSFTTSFLASANNDLKKYYFNTLKHKSVDEVNKMRDVATNATTIGGFGINSEYWFKTITKKNKSIKNNR